MKKISNKRKKFKKYKGGWGKRGGGGLGGGGLGSAPATITANLQGGG